VETTDAELIQSRLQAWRNASEAMAEMRAERLANLSQSESARRFDELNCDPSQIWRSPERLDGSGLVEQQRLFAKSRELDERHSA